MPTATDAPYARILVPVDGSATSIAGLREAIRLAKPLGSTLRLLHVINELVAGGGLATLHLSAELIASSRERGTAVLEEAAVIARAAGIEPELQAVEVIGVQAGVCIVEHARAWPADLIVLGTHGRKGVARMLLGSDAQLVLGTTPVPVLLVRGPRGAS